jgi:hypothetical protein
LLLLRVPASTCALLLLHIRLRWRILLLPNQGAHVSPYSHPWRLKFCRVNVHMEALLSRLSLRPLLSHLVLPPLGQQRLLCLLLLALLTFDPLLCARQWPHASVVVAGILEAANAHPLIGPGVPVPVLEEGRGCKEQNTLMLLTGLRRLSGARA